MTDLENYVNIVSKGKQDFNKRTNNDGSVTITIVTDGRYHAQFDFDKDGKYISTSTKQSKGNLIVSSKATRIENRNKPVEFFQDWVSKKVYKQTSLNPFKSTFFVNTVKSVTINVKTGLPAFTFEEDDSVVDCWICKVTI